MLSRLAGVISRLPTITVAMVILISCPRAFMSVMAAKPYTPNRITTRYRARLAVISNAPASARSSIVLLYQQPASGMNVVNVMMGGGDPGSPPGGGMFMTLHDAPPAARVVPLNISTSARSPATRAARTRLKNCWRDVMLTGTGCPRR